MSTSHPTDLPIPSANEPYPGRLSIVPWPDLPELERCFERDLAMTVQKKTADLLYDAIDLTYHGLVIDIDLYRELLPVYRLSRYGAANGIQRMNRTRYKVSTNAPARAAAADRYHRESALARRIIIVAGGPASGKTLALRSMVEHIGTSGTIVYETSMTDAPAAERLVRNAATHGRQVIIMWVYMPFRTAIDGMIRRALEDGRFVTMQNMGDRHIACRATILHLIQRCAGMPLVQISAIGNFGDHEEALPLDSLPTLFNHPSERISYDIALDQFHRSGLRYRLDPFLRKHLFEEYPAGLYDERPTRRAGEQSEHGKA